ncbi:uncharacterized protein LOC106773938 [Vigna radiata var. radiata]|uniref:Uncharacterized protein LOC106773938 n=1 Tax=Vigna radiata var. radiata TaxID=3916 RepID=A0A1S3VCV6_VIGRR|nr:uncharacterized protein LOC106773938 [Vigna radiata var. radiata]
MGTVLEITVICCENLRVKEDPYVVVRAESLKCCTTKMAKDSGATERSLFSWNERLMVGMPLHARSITFEVQSNSFKALRPVGVARISLSDFLTPENSMQVFSYRLRDWEGKRNGVIYFAVRVAVPEPVKGMVVSKNSGDEFVEIEQSDEVVVGVPLWWN